MASRRKTILLSGLQVTERDGRTYKIPWLHLRRKGPVQIVSEALRAARPELPRCVGLPDSPRAQRVARRLKRRAWQALIRDGSLNERWLCEAKLGDRLSVAVCALMPIAFLMPMYRVGQLLADRHADPQSFAVGITVLILLLSALAGMCLAMFNMTGWMLGQPLRSPAVSALQATATRLRVTYADGTCADFDWEHLRHCDSIGAVWFHGSSRWFRPLGTEIRRGCSLWMPLCTGTPRRSSATCAPQ